MATLIKVHFTLTCFLDVGYKFCSHGSIPSWYKTTHTQLHRKRLSWFHNISCGQMKSFFLTTILYCTWLWVINDSSRFHKTWPLLVFSKFHVFLIFARRNSTPVRLKLHQGIIMCSGSWESCITETQTETKLWPEHWPYAKAKLSFFCFH